MIKPHFNDECKDLFKKFLQLGVRPSLIPLSDRTMRVQFKGEVSELFRYTGGGPQGMLLGETQHLVQSNANADCLEPDDRFKYIDGLSVLQLLCLSWLLVEYDIRSHIGHQFVPPDRFKT